MNLGLILQTLSLKRQEKNERKKKKDGWMDGREEERKGEEGREANDPDVYKMVHSQ